MTATIQVCLTERELEMLKSIREFLIKQECPDYAGQLCWTVDQWRAKEIKKFNNSYAVRFAIQEGYYAINRFQSEREEERKREEQTKDRKWGMKKESGAFKGTNTTLPRRWGFKKRTDYYY